MKKFAQILTLAACFCVLAGYITYAGNSGVSDPSVTVSQFTTPNDLRDKTHETVDNLDTAIEAIIDHDDATAYETGSATNNQLVTLSLTYASAPLVLIETQNATTNSYASSITTTNFSANMVVGDTNKYVVIPLQ